MSVKEILAEVFTQIKGQKIVDIFYQPTRMILGDDIFVFNFSNGYSLHVACFVKISQFNEMVLTTTDQYTTPKYEKMKQYDEDDFIRHALLRKTITRSKRILQNAMIVNIGISEVADLNIEFDNGTNIKIILDCQQENYEYYRLFDSTVDDSESTVVGFKSGDIAFLCG